VNQGMPAIPLKKLGTVTPKTVGRFLGQKYANLYSFGGKSEAGKNPQKVQKAIDYWEKQKDKPSAANALRTLNLAKTQLLDLAKTVSPLEKNVLRAFKMALEQPNHQEAVEFFESFAIGLSKKGITSKGLAGATVATVIYSVMSDCWQEVDRLSSVPKLREFLINYGLPEDVVGDISRLRRLCNRVGYAPGKRGRPSKSKK